MTKHFLCDEGRLKTLPKKKNAGKKMRQKMYLQRYDIFQDVCALHSVQMSV